MHVIDCAKFEIQKWLVDCRKFVRVINALFVHLSMFFGFARSRFHLVVVCPV